MAPSAATPTSLTGIGVSPGLVAGPVARMAPGIAEPEIATLEPSRDIDKECDRIAAAAQTVKKGLELSAAEAKGDGRTLLETTAQMAADPTLTSSAQAMVRERRLVPERAVWEAAGTLASMLESLGGYMAERTRDVQDVRDRIVAVLTDSPMPGIPRLPEPFVLVAEDLAPADTALLDPEKVVAFVTSEGGPTSHTAILARALGMPAIVGTGSAVTDQLNDGDIVLVDGTKGTIVVDPSEDQLRRARELASRVRVFNGDGATKDGHEVQLLANVGDGAAARSAAEANAMGVGLFRTEFCFLDQPEEPSVDDQVEAYKAVLEAFPGKKVVVRTLDAGADKPLPFLTDATEANPALGVRAYRTTRRDPEVLDHQLEALAKAEAETEAKVWVMAPMISTVEEAKAFTEKARSYGLKTAGMMIEVPSAAIMADKMFEYADFASIGTNDLTQYVMAADRLLSSLADLSTAWQPAVLRLIKQACDGAAPHGRPVGVCGEAAADPALATVLVGLGVASLSMTARALPDVDAVLKTVDLAECQRLAGIATASATADEARQAVRAELPILEEFGL
ncbi:MAG: phosphoenolpyruvate--protein phosphotransferase [Actinomyces ruminicola]|uniref:Phosphoenolpyruvate-protein phosphotransferase n=1 Tax=Actinomyces ruminicola TaxID=332524 RepID=A0A1G9WK97_9ACTO|nr:phosphoenolpyruvate--protein phosphotransferase [Actinomyces ruminicola]MBE6481757.1 phosphoenolpyruvate--protein phosphotransferase [Actinomyces ruminicola]SDM84673.1 phosphotransferase system, enzyme I, PtsI [Actinomyces ruminicola]